MAGIKEIRTRIDSVQQTLKITNAMYLISSSKLRKARQQLNNVQPYFLKISSTIADILHHSAEIEHIYFDKRPDVKRRKAGYIVITGDKGLAGAYNHNVLRLAEKHLAQEDDPTLFLIGQMGRAYFAERDIRVDGEFMFTVQDPTIARARDIADIFIRLFREGQLDDVYVVYTEMITPMRLEPRVQKLLPLDLDAFPWEPRPSEHGPYHQMVQYVPSADRVLEHLVPGYVKGELFGALVESFCAEQNARMTAMDSATDNARDMLKSLSLRYNRARQSAITQEITEIVGGAQGSAAQRASHRRRQRPAPAQRGCPSGATESASFISGRLPPSKATSTTGPVTCTTVPLRFIVISSLSMRVCRLRESGRSASESGGEAAVFPRRCPVRRRRSR